MNELMNVKEVSNQTSSELFSVISIMDCFRSYGVFQFQKIFTNSSCAVNCYPSRHLGDGPVQSSSSLSSIHLPPVTDVYHNMFW